MSESAVSHWSAVFAGGRSTIWASLTGGAREKAVTFLVISKWLSGEASALGVRVSESEINRRVNEEETTYLSKAEFERSLSAARRTIGDLRSEVAAELAAERLHGFAVGERGDIRKADVVHYYEVHRQEYVIPETRVFDIYNGLTMRHARRLKREVDAGRDFAALALHEELERSATPVIPEKRAIEHAIFAAPAHTISEPVPFLHAYSLFMIKRIRPERLHSLAEVEAGIRHRLVAERERAALTAFITRWTARWKARTDCSRTAVVAVCKQSAKTPQLQSVPGLG